MQDGTSMLRSTRARERRTARGEVWLLLAAVVLLMTPALFDLRPIADATAPLEHTRDAVTGLISVLLTAGLVSAWAKRRADRRDRARFEGISGVAFRSLAQAANDAGRTLLAPVVGADLHAAGIPGFTPEHHAEHLALLHGAGIRPAFEPTSGVWDSALDRERLAADLTVLCSRPGFAALMFRRTSSARRRLQESMADWAPIMVNVPGTYDHLDTGWALSDRLVALLERWRGLRTSSADGPAPPEAVDAVVHEYLGTIALYQRWISELVPLSRLPG